MEQTRWHSWRKGYSVDLCPTAGWYEDWFYGLIMSNIGGKEGSYYHGLGWITMGIRVSYENGDKDLVTDQTEIGRTHWTG